MGVRKENFLLLSKEPPVLSFLFVSFLTLSPSPFLKTLILLFWRFFYLFISLLIPKKSIYLQY